MVLSPPSQPRMEVEAAHCQQSLRPVWQCRDESGRPVSTGTWTPLGATLSATLSVRSLLLCCSKRKLWPGELTKG